MTKQHIPKNTREGTPIQNGIGTAHSSAELLGEHDTAVIALSDAETGRWTLIVVRRRDDRSSRTIIYYIPVTPIHSGQYPVETFAPPPVTAWWRTPVRIALTPVTVAVDAASVPVFVIAYGFVAIGIATGQLAPN